MCAGDKYFPGWINVDRHGEQDVNADAFPLPFDADVADELHCYHGLEHLHRQEAGHALQEWFRVIKPGGTIVLELPCLDKIAQLIVDGEPNMRLTVFGLFGDPRDLKPDMLHKWCWSKAELTEALSNVGFLTIAIEEPIFHLARRDMRVTARKP